MKTTDTIAKRLQAIHVMKRKGPRLLAEYKQLTVKVDRLLGLQAAGVYHDKLPKTWRKP